jgi:hypothetical protein
MEFGLSKRLVRAGRLNVFANKLIVGLSVKTFYQMATQKQRHLALLMR